jgi:MOSC domain-containing protein YiiM
MSGPLPCGVVVAVSLSGSHSFSKINQPSVRLLAGLGVEGDAHLGKTVQHLSRTSKQPACVNLRQVHLIHAELLDELSANGFDVPPGSLGENVTTRGIDLLSLPVGTRLRLGGEAVVELTGLRNPCSQIDRFREGLLSQVLTRGEDGNLIRKSGVMSVVVVSGEVRPDDEVAVALPAEPHVALAPV